MITTCVASVAAFLAKDGVPYDFAYIWAHANPAAARRSSSAENAGRHPSGNRLSGRDYGEIDYISAYVLPAAVRDWARGEASC